MKILELQNASFLATFNGVLNLKIMHSLDQ